MPIVEETLVCMCVCVCVCERENKREGREIERVCVR